MSTTMGSLVRNSAVMAAGSFVSRVLGVVRASMIMSVFGMSLAGDAWAVANTLPNTIYMLLAGGILNAVLVPQIAKAQRDPDGGREYVDRLVTVAILGLLVITLVCVPMSPLLVALLSSWGWGTATFELSVAFTLICMPAIFFYGLYTIWGQILNAREQFGWYMWSPVLCNVVWIAGLAYFLARYGRGLGDPAAFTWPMIILLGGSLILGVALQAFVLLLPLWTSGFRYRPRLAFRGVGLGSTGRVAMWIFAALVVSQIGLVVQSRVLTTIPRGYPGKLPYDNAFLLFMTPHGLITVSIVTALFTSMSKAAAARDIPAVRRDVHSGLSLTGIATIPITIGSLVLGTALTAVVFAGSTRQATDAIGYVMQAMMVGLPAFAAYYVVQRAFFAFEDARTPFLLQLLNTAVALVVAVACLSVSVEFRAIGVALGQALSNVVAAAAGLLWLRRRLDGLPLRTTVRTNVRVVVACVPAVLVALAVFLACQAFIGGRFGHLVALLAGGVLFVLLYIGAARQMRVAELDDLLAPLLHRLRRRPVTAA